MTTRTGRGLFWALVASALLACGGADDAPPDVLFDGPPSELLPHGPGRTARFRVRVHSADTRTTQTATATTEVLHEGPDGSFVMETRIDDRPPRRTRARELENRIQLEATASSASGSFVWTELPEPLVLIETPVVRGALSRGGFNRTLDVTVRVDGRTENRTVGFTGDVERVARGWDQVVLAGVEHRVLVFDLRGDGRSHPVPGLPAGSDVLHLEVRGREARAVGIGLVREDLDLTIRLGDRTASIELQTEWLGDALGGDGRTHDAAEQVLCAVPPHRPHPARSTRSRARWVGKRWRGSEGCVFFRGCRSRPRSSRAAWRT